MQHANERAIAVQLPDDANPMREVLVTASYISQKGIEICAANDWQAHEELEMHVNAPGIESLHKTLREAYMEPEATGS